MTTYAELTTQIQDIVEDELSPAVLAMLVRQAERLLYQTVRLPSLRKTVPDSLTAATASYQAPADFLYPIQLAVIRQSGAYSYLIQTDQSFIREAYPNPTHVGVPKYYAVAEATQGSTELVVGPTPDTDSTSIMLTYGYYPESIVTAGQTYLGDNFDTALLNGSLIEAIRFIKGEEADVANYEKLYVQAVSLMKNMADGRIQQDEFRYGSMRT